MLDLGCGTGDVTYLVARLVGPTGAVIGVDASAEAIATAERRARVESGPDSPVDAWTRKEPR